jgi:hypothetical protein
MRLRFPLVYVILTFLGSKVMASDKGEGDVHKKLRNLYTDGVI